MRRKVEFFSLADLNRAIKLLLEDLNTRPLKKLPGSRRSQFDTLDRPAMRALPSAAYEFAEWKKARVGILCDLLRYVAQVADSL